MLKHLFITLQYLVDTLFQLALYYIVIFTVLMYAPTYFYMPDNVGKKAVSYKAKKLPKTEKITNKKAFISFYSLKLQDYTNDTFMIKRLVSQFWHETGGKSQLYLKHNNISGIKYATAKRFGIKSNKVETTTTEWNDSLGFHTCAASFASFGTIEQSIIASLKIANKIGLDGWATSPNYTKKVNNTLNSI